jgi:glycosyltransferase involved in cell wall biosynthesis
MKIAIIADNISWRGVGVTTMKIAIIADNISWRGVGVITKMQIKLLLERGISIVLVVPQNELKYAYDLAKMHSGKLDIFPIPNINVGFSQVIDSKRMSKYLNESLNDVDLIYIPNIYYWALGYAKRRYIPSVITINMPWPVCFYQNLFLRHSPCLGCVWSKSRSSLSDYVKLYQCIVEKEGIPKSLVKFPLSTIKRNVIEKYLTMATSVVAISQTVEKWLINRFQGLSDRIRVVYLGALFPPLPYVLPGSDNSKLRLFYFSAPDEEKGIFNLLKALSIAVKYDSNITLKIMGANSRVEAMVHELGLRNNVTLMSWYPSDKVFEILPEVIKDVDVVVVPCLNEDAWAGVTTQAMALGRPVLVNKIGGLKEQVIDGINGYYCNCNNIASFAKKLLELRMLSKDKIRQAGFKAREHYLNTYDPYKIIEQLIKVFNEALSEHKL